MIFNNKRNPTKAYKYPASAELAAGAKEKQRAKFSGDKDNEDKKPDYAVAIGGTD